MADKVALLVENESLRERVEELEEALEDIALWTMHHGHEAYKEGEGSVRGYYAEAFGLIEKEVRQARDRARRALNNEGDDG